jgi:predicted NUDIX family phosphoesterase
MGDFLTAAHSILKRAGAPLTAREITEQALKARLLESRGLTPWQTMKSKLSTDILNKKGRSLFKRTSQGRFALREWRHLDEHVADRFQKALFDEDVLVIPAGSLHRHLPNPGLYAGRIDSAQFRHECRPMRRRDAEADESVIQLVSAFILRHGQQYLTYKRAKRLPESRLHGFYSLTFGGHLNPDDLPPLFDIFDPEQGFVYLNRELSEEVILPKHGIRSITYRGLLYDESRPVSRQHVGIVYDVLLKTREYRIGERGFLIDSRFETITDILLRIDQFENWSTLLVREEIARMSG